jgi:hypothetical protein
MQSYLDHKGCLMEYLLRALDDPSAGPCGRCANCRGRGLSSAVSRDVVVQAEIFLKSVSILIQPHSAGQRIVSRSNGLSQLRGKTAPDDRCVTMATRGGGN